MVLGGIKAFVRYEALAELIGCEIVSVTASGVKANVQV